jgi:hypothetical protein
VRRRGGRKRANGTRAPIALPDGPIQRWSLDFVTDPLNRGRRFRILAIVDDVTRAALALPALNDRRESGLAFDEVGIRPSWLQPVRRPRRAAGERPPTHEVSVFWTPSRGRALLELGSAGPTRPTAEHHARGRISPTTLRRSY